MRKFVDFLKLFTLALVVISLCLALCFVPLYLLGHILRVSVIFSGFIIATIITKYALDILLD